MSTNVLLPPEISKFAPVLPTLPQVTLLSVVVPLAKALAVLKGVVILPPLMIKLPVNAPLLARFCVAAVVTGFKTTVPPPDSPKTLLPSALAETVNVPR